MIVDVGGGTSEVAVISLGGIVVSQSVRIGGYDFDEAIATHLKREHTLAIGEQTAENLKVDIGSAVRMDPEPEAEVRGRDLLTGLPKTLLLSSDEVRRACAEPLGAIVGAVKDTLERTPPELAADIADRGIMLRQETQLPVELTPSPLTCVAVGAGHSLEEFDALARLSNGRTRPRLAFSRGASFSRRR